MPQNGPMTDTGRTDEPHGEGRDVALVSKTVRAPTELWEAVEHEASQEGTSASEVVRRGMLLAVAVGAVARASEGFDLPAAAEAVLRELRRRH
jgi:hypothetical protein